MNLVDKFAQNTAGRDFVVGDIHGCFVAVEALLAKIGFDPQRDRMFSIGDLVDRGPQSLDALEWLDKPWFFAIRGNHEQMAIDHVAGLSNEGMYRGNGGGWFLALDRKAQERFARVFAELPIVAEIEIADDGLIGLVHADPVAHDWEMLKSRLENEHVQTAAIWSRTRIQSGDSKNVAGVSAVICGHTIIDEPLELGNVIYIDTGAIAGNRLSCVELSPSGLAVHSVKTSLKAAA